MTVARSHALFVYGTLRDPAVQTALFGREILGVPAILDGWALFRSETDGFHFIKPCSGDRVNGLILDLSDFELEMADAWEDVPLYQRERVPVLSGEDVVEAWAYTRREADGPKNTGEFASAHELRQVIEWARQLRSETTGRSDP
jgi:gamma-glutamylcyclotransferase (GGCT)/AIG2-like uncharacterized protein YtfP